MKSKTNISVVSNTGVRRKSEVIIGDSGTHTSGDILDANAVELLVDSKSGGSDMPIVYLLDDEQEIVNLESGKLYQIGFNLSEHEFVLPDPSSPEFVEHIIILGYIMSGWEEVFFTNNTYTVFKQTKESIVGGTFGGNYRIDCMFVGDGWLVTAVNVMPAIQ